MILLNTKPTVCMTKDITKWWSFLFSLLLLCESESENEMNLVSWSFYGLGNCLNFVMARYVDIDVCHVLEMSWPGFVLDPNTVSLELDFFFSVSQSISIFVSLSLCVSIPDLYFFGIPFVQWPSGHQRNYLLWLCKDPHKTSRSWSNSAPDSCNSPNWRKWIWNTWKKPTQVLLQKSFQMWHTNSKNL